MNHIYIYLLSAINPSKCVIHDLHKIFARFLWNISEMGIRKHWVAWSKICITKKEGLGFRFLFDIYKVLFSKLRWVSSTQKSMWTIFRWKRYCKKSGPQVVEWSAVSQTWKYLLKDRILLIKRSGGIQSVIILIFGMISRHSLEHCIISCLLQAMVYI